MSCYYFLMKKKRQRFTKRKLFTYRFKGREPRALLWRKGVFREWFEYGLLHQERGGNLPPEFGWLSDFKSFEEWWRHPEYGFELFCEPRVDDLAKVLSEPPKETDANTALISVSLIGDKELIVRDFKRALRSLSVPADYRSRARFQPSKEMQFLKPKKLSSYRETFLLTEEMKHREVVIAQGWIPDGIKPSSDLVKNRNYETFMISGLRRVGRHRKQVLKTFRNLQRGRFP